MFASPHSKTYIFIITLFLGLTTIAQVGIGTTSPNADALLDVDASTTTGGILLPRLALSSTSSPSPLSADVAGMIVYNTSTTGDVTPGFYINNGNNWKKIEEENPIDSVSLSSDVLISGSTFTDITGMSITFTAQKTNVLIMLSASGIGYTNSISTVGLRVWNTTDSNSIGGTNNKVQNLTIISHGRTSPVIDYTYTTTSWSANYSKLLTGLTVGNTYTIKVQGNTGNVYGTDGAAIYSSTYPDSNHLTLSVIH